jgi:hypothetical protein
MLQKLFEVYADLGECPAKHKLAETIQLLVNQNLGLNDVLTPQELSIGIRRGKIYCTKAVKDRTSMMLRDSLNLVENYFRKHNLTFGP